MRPMALHSVDAGNAPSDAAENAPTLSTMNVITFNFERTMGDFSPVSLSNPRSQTRISRCRDTPELK
jgi:hypothetical protein